MLTGTALMNELVDELNELKLSTMAATLDDLYHRPGFLEMNSCVYPANTNGISIDFITKFVYNFVIK